MGLTRRLRLQQRLNRQMFLRLANDVAIKGMDEVLEDFTSTTDLSTTRDKQVSQNAKWSKAMLGLFQLPIGEKDWERLFDRFGRPATPLYNSGSSHNMRVAIGMT